MSRGVNRMLNSVCMPFVRTQLVEPLYYYIQKSPRLSYWKELEESQFQSESVLREKQWKRVKRLINTVWENNAFYRRRFEEAGFSPRMLQSPDDLSGIPILKKADIRLYAGLMLSDNYKKEQLIKYKTGGSTGKALEIYLSEECSEMRNACARRHDRWAGWEAGEPVAAVWGNPVLPATIKDKLKNLLLAPVIYMDTMAVSEQSVHAFAAEWKKVKPTLLFGHSHSIYLLARYIRDLKIQDVKPRGILATSMMLMPHEREIIENVFKIKVTNRYGCEEVSLIASECEKHEGMHLNIEHLYIEFINENGEQCASGESGNIVVTDLMNYAMPFIRYQIEDVGVPVDKKCSCGRGLPLMDSVTGRTADFLIRHDGVKIAGVSLIENTLTKISGIDQMQLVQESLENIEVNLVVSPSYEKPQEEELMSYLADLFHNRADIQMHYVDEIKSEANGKYRFSICKIT